jgi:hypothetical protein
MNTSILNREVVVSFVIVRLCLVVLYSYTPQIFILQPSSTTDEESKSRRNRIPIGPMIVMHTTHLSILNLSRGLESGREATDVVGKVTLVAEELDVGTVNLDLALLAEVNVLLAFERSETPVLGDDDLLATRELVLATPESLESDSAVRVPSPDGHENLADVDTSDKTVGLAESTTHTGLQSIGTSARQHLVDTDDVVGVDADTEMERFLSTVLDEVLVGANTGGLERLGGQLLVLVGDQVNAEREVVYVGLLATKVEDADLGIGDTTVEPALGVGLVLAVAVATGGTAGHCDGISCCESMSGCPESSKERASANWCSCQ